jgi:hypothetical protein
MFVGLPLEKYARDSGERGRERKRERERERERHCSSPALRDRDVIVMEDLRDRGMGAIFGIGTVG